MANLLVATSLIGTKLRIKKELSEIVRGSGFNIIEHRIFLSNQISSKSLRRKPLLERNQIVISQGAH